MAAVYPGTLPTYTAAGTYLDSNPHDALHDNLYDEIVATATELGVNAKGSAASVSARIAALEADWTSVTSGVTTVSQNGGTFTFSPSGRKHKQVGNLVFFYMYVNINTGTGTAGYPLTLSLPHTIDQDSCQLYGMIADSSASDKWHGRWQPASSTTIKMYWDGSGSSDAWGVVPNLAVAASDSMRVHGIYKVA